MYTLTEGTTLVHAGENSDLRREEQVGIIGYHNNKNVSAGAERGRKDKGRQEAALPAVPSVPL